MNNMRSARHTMRDKSYDNCQNSSSIRDYEIKDKLGEGTYGIVYKCIDVKTKEVCVMKQVALDKTNPGELNDKMQEAFVMRSIRHPYVNKFKHAFCDDGKLCLINDYCDKGDLDTYLRN